MGRGKILFYLGRGELVDELKIIAHCFLILQLLASLWSAFHVALDRLNQERVYIKTDKMNSDIGL